MCFCPYLAVIIVLLRASSHGISVFRAIIGRSVGRSIDASTGTALEAQDHYAGSELHNCTLDMQFSASRTDLAPNLIK